ncbi:MAG: hypothetical protein CFE44_15085 [Burkholderiales bacterium PBB4]|nr:MAG: hypothetical protein CFE44_15085 [Burkholderiales bacterium PBB4]
MALENFDAAMSAHANAERYRPQVHFTAERNWINDPNGLVYWEGEYHLFYQYNPFGDQWGHMSWGHAVSGDLVHWSELPVAIPEDDRVSIFSGSVVMDVHNTSGFGDGINVPMVAIYTGCLRVPEGGQAQELAFSLDCGHTWTKYAGNPVLDLGLRDFRDPKVFWHKPTGRWVMLVSIAHEYRLAFYASDNLKDWEFLSDFKSDDTRQGIWECPDIFVLPVSGEAPVWVLKVDVLEGHPSEGSGAKMFLGDFDGTHFHLRSEQASPWADYGADFYAAVAWGNTEAVRTNPVWIGWMNCHRYAKHLPTSPWRGAMSLPRSISLQRTALGLQLRQQPVSELEALRKPKWFSHPDMAVQGQVILRQASHIDVREAFELHMVCEHSDALQWGGVWQTGNGECTRWGYDGPSGTVFIDRSQSGFLPEDPIFAKRRTAPCPAPGPGQPLSMRVYLDICSIELFVNDGVMVQT